MTGSPPSAPVVSSCRRRLANVTGQGSQAGGEPSTLSQPAGSCTDAGIQTRAQRGTRPAGFDSWLCMWPQAGGSIPTAAVLPVQTHRRSPGRLGPTCWGRLGGAGQAAVGAQLSKSMQGSTPCIIRNKRQCGQPATSNPTAPSQQGGWLLLLTGIAAGRWAAQPHVQLQPVHARQLLCAGHGNLHTERCVAGDGPVGKHRHSQRGRCRMGGQGGV